MMTAKQIVTRTKIVSGILEGVNKGFTLVSSIGWANKPNINITTDMII
jgi:hypothetical protein